MRKLQLTNQHYDCILCGRCCRRFFVQMTEAEFQRLSSLTKKSDFSEIRDGIRFFRRKSDGGCVFQGKDGLCDLHREYGFSCKALVCRGYPFSIMTTFPGEASVMVRLDCPAVIQEHGRPLEAHRSQIEKMVCELNPEGCFSKEQLSGLDKSSLLLFLSELQSPMKDDSLSLDQAMLAMMELTQRAERLGGHFLSDQETMKEVYPSLHQSIREDMKDLEKFDFSAPERTAFRLWELAFLRRDEEIPNTDLRYRIGRCWKILKIVLGGGNLRALSQEHPDISLKQCRQMNFPVPDRTCARPYLRFLQAHLDSLQFFGPAYYGTNVFSGLRALLLTWSIARHLAGVHATASHNTALAETDFSYAVQAIDHCFGRTPALHTKTARKRETLLATKFSSVLFQTISLR